MKSEKARVLLLCTDGDSTRAVYNALRDEFGRITVVMEEPVTRLQMAKRRAARLGYLPTIGQMAFAGLVVPVLLSSGRARIDEIERGFNLRKDLPDAEVVSVENVNSHEAREVLRRVDPEVVVVNGTRIISPETLGCVEAPFINMHAGVTPLYRGVHGGYWALAEGNGDLVGTTVHFVDKGIDTGTIIEQAFFEVTEEDNFATYPYLHTAAGIPVLIKAVRRALGGDLSTSTPARPLESKLRHHPTIWGYFQNRLRRGVK